MQNAALKTQTFNPQPEMQVIGLQPRYLISKYVDWLLIGGASIFALAVIFLSVPQKEVSREFALLMYNFAFLVNYPHFMASYFMLYDDYRKKIFTEFRFFWAAIIVPTIILGLLALGFNKPNSGILNHLTNSLFFFVGWHYVKQIFGGIIVTNSFSDYFYNQSMKYALKINLISLWAVSFLSKQTKNRSAEYYGINYHTYDLPDWTLQIAYGLLAVTGLFVIVLHIFKYLKDSMVPSFSAVVCYLSIYAWFVPMIRHSTYLYIVPLFHSLQYLLFAYAFRKNKIEADMGQTESQFSNKKKWLTVAGYFFMLILFGGMLMHFIPSRMDNILLKNSTSYGVTPFYFSFLLFINIHHYFIDNVIWRSDNDQMRDYLLKPRSKVAEAAHNPSRI